MHSGKEITGLKVPQLGGVIHVTMSPYSVHTRDIRVQGTSEFGRRNGYDGVTLSGCLAATSRNRVHLFLKLKAAAGARASDTANAQDETIFKKIRLWPSRIVDPAAGESEEQFQTPETADNFFRGKGPAAPGLMAASLLDSLLLALHPEQEERHAVRAGAPSQRQRRSPVDEDWSSFEKYDIFRELLTTSPLLKEAKFQPLKALLRAAPKSGPGKYDFFQALLESMSKEPQGSHRWDLVHEILQKGREEAQSKADAGYTDRLKKYDIVHDLLHSALIHADWGLPTSGLAYELLHLDEWGTREHDPVARLLESIWHGRTKYKWDPMTAVADIMSPTLRAKWDPLQSVLALEAPSGTTRVNPFGELLQATKIKRQGDSKYNPLPGLFSAEAPARGSSDPIGGLLQAIKIKRQGDSKYNPLPGLFSAEAPARGGSDPIGDVLRGLRGLDLRGTPDAIGDIIKGLINVDLRGSPDMVGDIIKSLNRAADIRSAPSLSGLSGGHLPRAEQPFTRQQASGRADPNSIEDAIKTLQAVSSGGSEYQPLFENLAAGVIPQPVSPQLSSSTGSQKEAGGLADGVAGSKASLQPRSDQQVPESSSGGRAEGQQRGGKAASQRPITGVSLAMSMGDPAAESGDKEQNQALGQNVTDAEVLEARQKQGQTAKAGNTQAVPMSASKDSLEFSGQSDTGSAASSQSASQQEADAQSRAAELKKRNQELQQLLNEAEKRRSALSQNMVMSQHKPTPDCNLLPDILRLQGAHIAPVAGYDPIGVLERRGGPQRVQALTSAFRELSGDSSLAAKHTPLFQLLESSRMGSRDVSDALNQSDSLLRDLDSSQKYRPLASLLSGQRPETVVGTICALQTLTGSRRT